MLLGSSLGAVAALSTAFRHPGVYGALALNSGSFIFDRGLLEDRDPLFRRWSHGCRSPRAATIAAFHALNPLR